MLSIIFIFLRKWLKDKINWATRRIILIVEYLGWMIRKSIIEDIPRRKPNPTEAPTSKKGTRPSSMKLVKDVTVVFIVFRTRPVAENAFWRKHCGVSRLWLHDGTRSQCIAVCETWQLSVCVCGERKPEELSGWNNKLSWFILYYDDAWRHTPPNRIASQPPSQFLS